MNKWNIHHLSKLPFCCRLKPGETWVGEMVIRSHDSMWERPLFEFDHEQARTAEAPPAMNNMQPNAQWR